MPPPALPSAPLPPPADHGRAPTLLVSWVLTLVRALTSLGLDAPALLRQAGITPDELRDPGGRLSLAQSHALWTHAVAASGDPLIGLEVARSVTPNTFQALGYTLMAAGSLREVLDALVRYVRMLADNAQVQLTEEGPNLQVDFVLAQGPHRSHTAAVDAAMCVLFHACLRLTDAQCDIVEVRLQRPAPTGDDLLRYKRFFRHVPLVFGDTCNRVTLDRFAAQVPNQWANAELVQANAAVVERYLARVNKDDVCNRVRLRLVECLPRGEPTPQEVADALHLSLRSLQRQLADAGTTFRDLLAETRREQACLLLRSRHLSISEVAHSIGFAEVSSFTRAFRRWMGCSPSDWRQRDQ